MSDTDASAFPWPWAECWIPGADSSERAAVVAATLDQLRLGGYTEIEVRPGVLVRAARPAAPPPPRPWWELAEPGAALDIVADPCAVYVAAAGAAWTRAPLRPGADGIKFWGWAPGEWVRVLKDSPPTFPGGLWVRAGDVRLRG